MFLLTMFTVDSICFLLTVFTVCSIRFYVYRRFNLFLCLFQVQYVSMFVVGTICFYVCCRYNMFLRIISCSFLVSLLLFQVWKDLGNGCSNDSDLYAVLIRHYGISSIKEKITSSPKIISQKYHISK